MRNRNKAFWGNFWRVLIILALAAVYLHETSTSPALAYGGDYTLRFDGINDYVSLASCNNILGSNWQSTKTISVWVKPTGAAPSFSGPGLIIDGDIIVGDHPRWFGIYRANITSINQDRIWIINHDNGDTADSTSTDPFAYIGIPYTVGEWVHITLVHNNYTLYAYKNGVLVGSQPSGRTAYLHDNLDLIELRIGGREFVQRFEGEIDEVRMWNTSLSADEIRRDMYRTLSGGETGLAAYYQMSDGSSTTLSDNQSSLPDWDGTLVGTPTWVTSGAFTGPRNALYFDGSNNYVSVPANISMPANLTLEAWIYPQDDSSGQKWIVGELGGVQLTMNGNQAQFRINSSGLQGPATATLTVGQWQHLAGTYDGIDLRIYVNGIAGTTAAFSGTNADQGNIFAIGGDGASQDNNIIIDEVRMWNEAKTVTQIRDKMFQNIKGDESGLVVYYRFDQDPAAAGGSTTLYDISNNGHHGSLISMNPATDWIVSTAFTTWIGSENSEWTNGDNWSPYTAPSATDNVGVTNYLGSNNPEISGSVNIKNLVIGSNSTLTVNSGGGLNVTSNLFNNGSIIQTQDIDGSSAVSFFNTGNYGGLTIDPDSQDMGDTVVTIRGNQDCVSDDGEVQRCFDISPSTSPISGTFLTFYFDDNELSGNNCNNLEAYHWNGIEWMLLDINTAYGNNGHLCESNPNSLQVSGVTNYSPFSLKERRPTAIILQRFSGKAIEVGYLPILGLLLLIGFLLCVFFKKRTQIQQL